MTESYYVSSFRQRDEFQEKHAEAMKDPSAYLANPINAYLLTKRLTTDWKKLEDEIRNDEISSKKNFILIGFNYP